MTQLKSLIKEVERLKEQYKVCFNSNELKIIRAEIQGIKQTVEAVDNITGFEINWFDLKDWQTLKRLLGVK